MTSIFDSADQENIDRKLAVALERVSQGLKSLVWEESKTSGLSPIQIQFLTLLLFSKRSAVTIGLLAAQFALTPATVSDAVTALEHKGLVERIRNAPDRRTVNVVLTVAGRRTAKKVSRWANALMDAVSRVKNEHKVDVLQALAVVINGLVDNAVIAEAGVCVSCSFFEVGGIIAESGMTSLPYCLHFNRNLAANDLRVDCPEHQLRSTQ